MAEIVDSCHQQEQRVRNANAALVGGIELRLVGESTGAGKAVRTRGLAGARVRRRAQTARRLRPLARRRLRTRRPLFVAMRARNPWVRFRCRLLG
jgi:hypothetical protein